MTMTEVHSELSELFSQPNNTLQHDVMQELQSTMRLHSFSTQELFFKWEAYSIKMGAENTRMDLKTARDFKKDLQDALERDSRAKHHNQSASKRGPMATPRSANTGDVYGVLDGLVTGTPRTGSANTKRKNNFDTPSAKASRTNFKSSPADHKTSKTTTARLDAADTSSIPFEDRQNAGQIIESLNAHITIPPPSGQPPSEARVKLKANTELGKFNYRPMAMKLTEASEILDDRIDEFAALVQEHHNLPDTAFGNPAAQNTAEIVTVGRIASDTPEGKMNPASVVLETSRRMGAGLRIPLRMDGLAYDFFPGKIVALRGTNPSGEYFSVSEVLAMPLLPLPASKPAELETHNARLMSAGEGRPLNMLIASGPFTPDTDLSFSALHALLDRAADTSADVLILNGPFLDIEHPLIASGDFTLPDSYPHATSDTATLLDAFRAFISTPLTALTQRVPSITIILVPSIRDAVSKHVSWPQDRLVRRDLGLPKQVSCVTNPITLSINEMVVAISAQDVLYDMQRQSVATRATQTPNDDGLARLAANLIQQRHFFPVFPPLPASSLPKPTAPRTISTSLASGADADAEAEAAGLDHEHDAFAAVPVSLDLAYLKLGEWLQVRPDVLITPSALPPFAKVVDSVLVVNPGSLSKRRAVGTFAQMGVGARVVREEEVQSGAHVLGHEVFARARVDVVRI